MTCTRIASTSLMWDSTRSHISMAARLDISSIFWGTSHVWYLLKCSNISIVLPTNCQAKEMISRAVQRAWLMVPATLGQSCMGRRSSSARTTVSPPTDIVPYSRNHCHLEQNRGRRLSFPLRVHKIIWNRDIYQFFSALLNYSRCLSYDWLGEMQNHEVKYDPHCSLVTQII